ncbi:WD40 repeat-like protein [Pholiota conissans]|uniref:WD40 repeat-like protein n=1 Tax=Pholiota conissans TaxID=109636 RepID=A0A9P5ZCJ3_9AGAR|nr:WD40 repeat-like protein [Pholiota conissans]
MLQSNPALLADEGFIDGEALHLAASSIQMTDADELILSGMGSVRDTEELAYKLLASLPRSRLATIQRRIAPLLQFDVVGSLPTEVALQIFSYLPFQTLLVCGLISRRWQSLANDQSLWKILCQARGWKWQHAPRAFPPNALPPPRGNDWGDSDDEGMGDSDEDDDNESTGGVDDTLDSVEAAKAELTLMHAELDSGFASMSMSPSHTSIMPILANTKEASSSTSRYAGRSRYFSAPSILKSIQDAYAPKPDYKLLHQTHIKIRNRILSSSYRFSALQTRGAPSNAHTNTIYCLQLYTYPETGKQVLFTGSRDKTIREWNLSTSTVERVIANVHNSSILSICVHNGYLASAGSDRRVAVWNLETDKLVKVLCDHEDSVLCVRFDDRRLVSCSKDRTVRVYSFPDLEFQFVLGAHRAAVNAVSISESCIVSASGDRSVRLWDAETGKLLRTFDNHHTRGIASIEFSPPFVLSGSSDKHLRLFDMTTSQGWSTCPEYDGATPDNHDHLPFQLPGNSGINSTGLICQSCGSNSIETTSVLQAAADKKAGRCMHNDLVRTVALGEDFVLSGSYDLTIKVWDRKTGNLVADLTGGHNGRIFCIGFDSKKARYIFSFSVSKSSYAALRLDCVVR